MRAGKVTLLQAQGGGLPPIVVGEWRATRAKNREKLDVLVLALMELRDQSIRGGHRGWVDKTELEGVTGFSWHYIAKSLTYLEHCYELVKGVGVSGQFLMVAEVGLVRYEDHDRRITCECPGCLFEDERLER